MPRFIDQFDVLLFDLMDTLMFGGNCFSAEQDYACTYRRLGGTYLTDRQVQTVIHDTWCRMSEHYGDPAYRDNFRSANHYLAESLTALHLPHTDLAHLHDVFAEHEIGHIPDSHCEALRQLVRTHRLGLVSNLWAGKTRFVEAFEQGGIHDLFEVLIFSSDYNSIKPAPTLFQTALGALRIESHQALFIGDDVDRDIGGAAPLGMQTVLVGTKDNSSYAGRRLRDVAALLTE